MWHLPERASGWRRLVQAGIWAVGLYVGLGAVLQNTGTGAAQSTESAVVVRMIDGDTIEVQVESGTATVRLMGIDTPETTHPTRPVEYYGLEAAALTETALSGKTVTLTPDVTGDREDQYGRLLRYVTVQGVDFNAALVREGYARAVRGFSYSRRTEFIALEDAARSRGVGLWGRERRGKLGATVQGNGPRIRRAASVEIGPGVEAT